MFCRKALTAGWWMTNEAAFSGATKLRLLRGRLELGAPAGGSPARRPRATVPPRLVPAPHSHDGIMPLLLLRSAMVLRLWLARVALLASFFLRSCMVSRLCPWPRGLPATAVELSCRYLRQEQPTPRRIHQPEEKALTGRGRACCFPLRSPGGDTKLGPGPLHASFRSEEKWSLSPTG